MLGALILAPLSLLAPARDAVKAAPLQVHPSTTGVFAEDITIPIDHVGSYEWTSEPTDLPANVLRLYLNIGLTGMPLLRRLILRPQRQRMGVWSLYPRLRLSLSSSPLAFSLFGPSNKLTRPEHMGTQRLPS